MKLKIPLTFKFYQDGEYWVGKCIELDILVAHPTLRRVKKDIKTISKMQCKFAIKNKLLSNLFREPTQESTT